MEKTILYTITGCVYCYKATEHLMKEDISFLEINILNEPARSRDIKRLVGEVKVPVLSLQGEIYSSYNQISKIKRESQHVYKHI